MSFVVSRSATRGPLRDPTGRRRPIMQQHPTRTAVTWEERWGAIADEVVERERVASTEARRVGR